MSTNHEQWDFDREEAEAASSGRPSTPWWAFGVAGVVVALGVTAWFGIASTQNAVTSTDIGFERTDSQRIIMTFDVTRPPGTTVTCTIAAMDGDYGRVGTAKHTVAPSDEDRTTRVTAPVRTTTEAVTATVTDCTASR